MTMTKPTSEQVTFLQAGSGATQRTALAKMRDVVSVKDFGAVGDGVTDDTAAIQLALNASNNIVFPNGSYRITTQLTKVADNVNIDFGTATIINDGPTYTFVFGTLNDLPQNKNLLIAGGNFTQSNPSTSSNRNYILIQAISKFVIDGCTLQNVSNGGITVYAGAEDGVIQNVTINGKSNYSTIRGIWLNGATATGWSAQYVNTSSITRNATAFPLYAVKNIKISNCSVILDAYGIYLINSWNCVISNCFVDISGTGRLRCIALNSYCPQSRVVNCELVSDGSSTGILITQVSDNVVVANNVFRGSFGGNRAIYVQYLASAIVNGNRFSDNSTQHIQIDTGGFACVKNNEFVRSSYTASNRAVFVTAIDAAAVNTTQGESATILENSGVVFTNNFLSKVPICALGNTSFLASNSNKPSFSTLIVNDNVMQFMDLCVSTERACVLESGVGANITNVRCERNIINPYSSGGRSEPLFAGSAFILESAVAIIASFQVNNPAAAGTIVVTKIAGNNISLSASRSGANLVISPRTNLGSVGSAVPIALGITDAGGTTIPHTYIVTPTGSNFTVSAYNSAGASLSFATLGIKFNILLGPCASGT